MTDFFIGFFLMNAMPHLLFGLFKIRFLSAFGFSPMGNIAYAFLNGILALALLHAEYGLPALMHHGVVLGAGTILFLYLGTGQYLGQLFQEGVRDE